ncbi:HNH endonuclease family protein, partial [Staphylococcus aureus]|nr:HNH endonuclease family protein [Staphylococcus aureus]
MDAASQSTKSPVLSIPSHLPIEHVLPQTWQTHWPLPADLKDDPVAEREAIAKRQLILNTLGNLTLITGPF